MKKILIPALILLLLPVMVLAADEAALTDSQIEIGGYTLIVVGTVDEVEVTSSKATFTLAATSDLVIKSNDRKILANNLGLDVLCGDTYSQISIAGNSLGSSLEVSIGDGTCVSTTGGGGGGDDSPTTTTVTTTVDDTTPVTTTGEVTATASGGGETTLTSSEGTTAAVNMPAGAVSASTDVTIEEKEKETITASRPMPTSRQVVGNYVYDYSAVSEEETIDTFDKDVTLTMTYTDDQISGLEESTLRIYYWKESTSQWVALPTSVDADTNTLTATVNHFTYFAILGLDEDMDEEEEEVVTEAETIIVDGDLIRNPDAEGMAQFDIYIVKIVNSEKFKRLILSPHVFESYAHFDKDGDGSPWDDVMDVDQTTMNQYTLSDLVRVDGNAEVYQLTASGDTGTKKWLNMTAEEFANRGYNSNSIYTINAIDRDAYATGADIT